MPSESVDALLFDLGNVVIEIDFNRALAHWAAQAHCEESLIRDRFRHDHAYDQHERGKIDLNAYFSALRANLGVDISDAHLRDGWNAILIGAMPGISDLLASAAERFPLFAFTNSNPEHQRCLSDRFADLLRPFRQSVRVLQHRLAQTGAQSLSPRRRFCRRARTPNFVL